MYKPHFKSFGWISRTLPCFATATANLACSLASGQCGYDAVIMPFPSGYSTVQVQDFNEAGTVVGFRRIQGGSLLKSAFRWDPESGYVTLPPPPGGAQEWTATRISLGGYIAGDADVSGISSQYHQIVAWDPRDQVTLVPPQIPPFGYEVKGILDDGTIVGSVVSGPRGQYPRPFCWRDGSFARLPEPIASQDGKFQSLNDLGWMGGYTSSTTPRGETTYSSVLWREGSELISLSLLPPQFIVPGFSALTNDLRACLTAREVIPGIGQASRTFFWSGSQLVPVGPHEGPLWTTGSDINDLGQIVGYTSNLQDSSAGYPFLWNDGTFMNLRSLVTLPANVMLWAGGRVLNDGRILCLAWFLPNFNVTGVILTPNTTAEDVNVDCHVDAKDLAILLGSWGTVTPLTVTRADVDHDGEVGPFDLAALLTAWTVVP